MTKNELISGGWANESGMTARRNGGILMLLVNIKLCGCRLAVFNGPPINMNNE
jgi:hypothetical protein